MSTPNDSDFLLFISSIILSLFFFFSAFVVCRRIHGFCERYCICQGCCCVFDRDAYQQEREHLRRLRELRQRRAEFTLATFTQIPGPIPDTDLRTRESLHILTSLGFILVTPVSVRQDNNSIQMRDQLTAEQRRDILDRILSGRVSYMCHMLRLFSVKSYLWLFRSIQTYHVVGDIESKTKNVEQEESQAPVQSYAFPLHEEPETPEKTCAICLDDFGKCIFV